MRDDCINWHRRTDKRGYGRVTVQGRGPQLAHRVAYERAHGPIPPDMTVDHLCFNPACVNVSHLRLLTRVENARNQRSAQKTHCVNGHEFTPENTYLRAVSGSGTRQCRTCNREAVRRYAKRQAA